MINQFRLLFPEYCIYPVLVGDVGNKSNKPYFCVYCNKLSFKLMQLNAGNRCIFGLMVESHLVAGAQKFSAGKDDPAKLAYGQSITDACIGWPDSLTVLDVLSHAVKERR